MFRFRSLLLVLVLFTLIQPAAEAQLGASLAMRALRPLVSRAIEGASDQVEDADPFVFSVIFFLERREQRAANSFVEGLINNDINDEDTVRRILNSITGVSIAGGVAMALAGNDDFGRRLAMFGTFIQGSPHYAEWRRAVDQGRTVRIVDGEMVISGGDDTAATALADEEEQGYRQTRENEVVPFLNLIHGSPGARIYIDGEQVDTSVYEEYMFDRLPAGLREITIRDAYSEARIMVFVNPGRETPTGFDEMEVEMQRGRFHLTVDPGIDGLPVYIDLDEIGTTPLENVPIRAGPWTVRIASEWNDPVEWEIDGQAGLDIEITDTVEARGAVRFSPAVPEDAAVEIAGEVIDFTYDRIYLPPGRHAIRITGETFYPFEDTVSVRPADSTRINPELDFRTGSIVLDPLPQGAVIALNGIPLPPDEDIAALLSETVIGEQELMVARLTPEGSPDEAGTLFYRFTLEEHETVTFSPDAGTALLVNVPDDGHVSLAGADGFPVVYLPIEETAEDERVLQVPDLLPGEYSFTLSGASIAEEQVRVVVPEEGTAEVRFDARRTGGLELVFVQRIQFELLDVDESVVAERSNSARYESTLPEGPYLLRARRRDDIEWGFYEEIRITPGETRTARYDVPYSHPYQLREINAEITAEEARLRGKQRRRVVSYVGTGLTVVAGALAEYFASETIANYDDYTSATTSDDAESARAATEDSRLLMAGSLITTGVLGATTGIIYATTLGQRGIRTRLAELRDEERRISAEMARESAGRAFSNLNTLPAEEAQ